MKNFFPIYFLIGMFSLSANLFGANSNTNHAEQSHEELNDQSKALPVETNHSFSVEGKKIDYKAIAGTLPIKNNKGETRASIFYTAYFKEPVVENQQRPLAFCFNGGPGSASVWLHLGCLGPKVVACDEHGIPLYPYHLIENPYSLLESTDLVFVDPVGTGYSITAPGVETKEFLGVEEDYKSMAEFVRLFATHYNRWTSPLFLIGESYGTTRVVATANELREKSYLNVQGLVLISPALNFLTFRDGKNGNDLPFILSLPSYALSAQYHHKINETETLENLKARAEKFAFGEYAAALLQGEALDGETRQRIVNSLSSFTGLSPEYLERANLRVPNWQFCKELLRANNRTLGHFDGRVLGIDDASLLSSCVNFDPSIDSVIGAFTACFNQYAKSDLNYQTDAEYNVLVRTNWNYGSSCSQCLDVSDDLREVLNRTPQLSVFIASGLYDLAIPYLGAIHTLNHVRMDPTVRERIKTKVYTGGHMMYLGPKLLPPFMKDMNDFIKKN